MRVDWRERAVVVFRACTYKLPIQSSTSRPPDAGAGGAARERYYFTQLIKEYMYIVPIMRGRGGLLLVILFCVGALQLILFRKSKFYHQKDNTIAPTSRNNTNDYDDDATTASKLQNDIRILARIKELEERLKEYESEFQDNTPSSTNADAKSITQEDAPSYLNWQWDNSQEVAPQNWTFQST